MLVQQLGIEATIDFVLVRRITIRVKHGDQGAQSRCQNDQIAGVRAGGVSVGHAGGHENRRSGSGGLGAAGVAKSEFAREDVPGFVIGVMDVKRGGTTAAPLVNTERSLP